MFLQDLPMDILTECVKHLIEGSRDAQSDLKALRLTSKGLDTLSAPFLINFARVYISSASLTRLEEISEHVAFSGSVRSVKINVSFYDKNLADDFALFAKFCARELLQSLNMYELFTRFNPGHYSIEEAEAEAEFQRGKTALEDWELISESADGKCNPEKPMGKQVLLYNAHREYARRYQDQESVKHDNEHMQRIGACLKRFNNLRAVLIDDSSYRFDYKSTLGSEQGHKFSDEALTESCLRAMHWKGAFPPSRPALPPVELIPSLFDTLKHFSIFPSEFQITFTPPHDLTVLRMSESQLLCISHVLRHAKKLSFNVNSWARLDSFGGDNTRPLEEIQHLGNLTRAFFDVPDLQSLTLTFGNYPVYAEIPQISSSQILPQRTWSSLHTLILSHIPFYEHERIDLIERHRQTIEKLTMEGLYLLTGAWADVVERMRQFSG